jgi:hypothetical protein
MTGSSGSITSRCGSLKALEDFSVSMKMICLVPSERVVLGNDPTAGDRTTPPQAVDVSRIEMRLLMDTRKVLEYLSMAIIAQRSADGLCRI